MLCARATLTAGPNHKRYEAGTAVRAIVFHKAARHPSELRGENFKGLAGRGWIHMNINGHKLVPDKRTFEAPDSPEAQAFRAALDKGYGILVLGPAK